MAFGVVVTGKGPYGRVERIGPSCVLTTFAHFWFLPIVPHGSYVRSEADSEVKEVGIGMHVRSILATYARVWGLIWLLVCAIFLSRGERDVARYSRAQAHDLREALERILIEEGRGQRFGYRDGQDPRLAWREIALHDDVRDPKYLEAALTRARLESRWASSRGERRAQARAHDRIWEKLAALTCRMDPSRP